MGSQLFSNRVNKPALVILHSDSAIVNTGEDLFFRRGRRIGDHRPTEATISLPERLNQCFVGEGARSLFLVAALEPLSDLFQLLTTGNKVGDDRLVFLLLTLNQAEKVLDELFLLAEKRGLEGCEFAFVLLLREVPSSAQVVKNGLLRVPSRVNR